MIPWQAIRLTVTTILIRKIRACEWLTVEKTHRVCWTAKWHFTPPFLPEPLWIQMNRICRNDNAHSGALHSLRSDRVTLARKQSNRGTEYPDGIPIHSVGRCLHDSFSHWNYSNVIYRWSVLGNMYSMCILQTMKFIEFMRCNAWLWIYHITESGVEILNVRAII